MPYEVITPEQFKATRPAFATVPDDLILQYIGLAGRFVDQSWTEADYQPAMIAMTCHLMTLDGYGNSGEADLAQAGGARITSIKSGTLSLTFEASASTGDDFKDWLGQTACGKFYLTLLRLNKAGPRLLTGWGMGCASRYAKDWPYKFPGIGQQ